MSTEQKEKIWVLEDNDDCLFVYKRILDQKYDVTYVKSINELHEVAEKALEAPDLLIADLILPDGSFISTFRDFKVKGYNVPTIVVSSVDDEAALFNCFDDGAVDYLIKPFNKSELLVKMFNALNDPRGRFKLTVSMKNAILKELTAKEKKVINTIIKHGGKADRYQIVDEVWGGYKVHPKTLDVHLTNIRKKLLPHKLQIEIYEGAWSLSPL